MSPGLDLVADGRPAMVTTPWNGAPTWPGLAGSAFSAAATSAATLRSRTLTGLQLAVDGGHHRAVAALVRLADGLQPDQQVLALGEVDAVLLALDQAVEVVDASAAPRGRRTSPAPR